MVRQGTLYETPVLPADVVYTPEYISKWIIDFLNPVGEILDPCKGDGAFLKHLPGADYCEIKEGLDFFDYNKKVDWIIGNPPYSIFKDFLEKSFELAENVSFLVPTNKVFQRQIIMEMINKWGGGKIYYSLWFWKFNRIPFWFQCRKFSFQKRL